MDDELYKKITKLVMHKKLAGDRGYSANKFFRAAALLQLEAEHSHDGNGAHVKPARKKRETAA